MIIVSEEKIDQRWDALSPALREALVSEINSEFMWRTCEAEHIPKEKIYEVGRIVGYVLLGFVHPEDLAHELKTFLAFNPQTADSISTAINNRVFVPLKEDLGQIFEPPSKLGLPASQPPRLVEEIKTAPASSPPAPPAPSSGSMGEFARLGMVKEPATPEKPKPPVVNHAEPPPTMLHEETPIKPAQQVSSFKIETPTPKLSDIKSGASPDIPKPAVIDFGRYTAPSTPPPPKIFEEGSGGQAKPFDATQSKPPRIVHYTEFRTPLENQAEVPDRQPPPNIPLAEKELPTGEFAKLPEKEAVPPTPPVPPRPRIEPPEIRTPSN